jgi:hypothetical protein
MANRLTRKTVAELVSGSNWSTVREAKDWMLKQVQHDSLGSGPQQ